MNRCTRFRCLVAAQLTALGATAAVAAGAGDLWQPGRDGQAARRAAPVDSARLRAARDFGRLPLAFEANRGQVDPAVLFLARLPGATLYLTERGAALRLRPRGGRDRGADPGPGAPAVLAVRFEGASAPAAVRGSSELPGRAHYFRGSDPERWVTDVPRYGRVEVDGLYPGVDLVYYGRPAPDGRQHLEYDLVVAPGADPDTIRLAFTGAGRVELEEGDLLFHTPAGVVRQHRPVAYQMTPEGRREIASRYRLLPPAAGGTGACQASGVRAAALVAFELEPHDPRLPLVIDPVLTYSTFLGGSAVEDDPAVAIDAAGSAYVAGITFSDDYPVTPGAPQDDRAGGGDVVVSKLNPAGTALVYSTYLGGSDVERLPDIAVDGSGSAFVAVETASPDYPTTPGAFDRIFNGGPGCVPAGNSFGGTDVAVTKLNPAGSGIVYSTFLGGRDGEGAPAIALGAAGAAYVALQTSSFDYPTTPGAFDRELNDFIIRAPGPGRPLGGASVACAAPEEEQPADGEPETGSPSARLVEVSSFATDIAVTCLNAAGSGLVYSTYLGGRGPETHPAIAVHSGANAFVVCTTGSFNYPVTMGAFDTSFNGFTDFGVTQLNAAGSDLVYSTFLGGSLPEFDADIAVDEHARAVVTGITIHAGDPRECEICPVDGYPVTPGAFNTTPSETADVVATRLNAAGNALLFSTFLGQPAGPRTSVALDAARRVFTAFTADMPLPTTPDAVQDAPAGGADIYIIRLDEDGAALGYATYLGGGQKDAHADIAVAPLGSIFAAGVTHSSDFPLAPVALDPSLGGVRDLTVSRISELFPTLTPPANPVAGREQCFEVLVEDEFGRPAPGVVVTFVASGNTGLQVSESMLTGPDGRAVFCFTPAFPGRANVIVCVDADNDGRCDPEERFDSEMMMIGSPVSTQGLAVGSGAIGVNNGAPQRGGPRFGTGVLNFTFLVAARRDGAQPGGRFSVDVPGIGFSGRAVQLTALVLGPPGFPRTGRIYGVMRTNQVGLMVPFLAELVDVGRGRSPDRFTLTLLADTDGDMVPEIHTFGGVVRTGGTISLT